MKSQNEKLKAICDEIGYLKITYHNGAFTRKEEIGFRVLDVREIIFTQEFKVRLYGYFYREVESVFEIDLMNNLDDPVSYLYNFLELGK